MQRAELGEQTFDRNKVDDASSGSHFVRLEGEGGREGNGEEGDRGRERRGEKKLIFSKMNAAKSKYSRINLSAKSSLFSGSTRTAPLTP